MLDLGKLRGSAEVFVNGESAGIMFCAPWTLPVRLRAGENLLELEVASTLGPLAGRGIPTAFGPEDQRFTGVLGSAKAPAACVSDARASLGLVGPAFVLRADGREHTDATMERTGDGWSDGDVHVRLREEQASDGSWSLWLEADGVRRIEEVCLRRPRRRPGAK